MAPNMLACENNGARIDMNSFFWRSHGARIDMTRFFLEVTFFEVFFK